MAAALGRGLRRLRGGREAGVAARAGRASWCRTSGWAERGGYGAIGHGNSVPRFHVTWGTGPGVVEPFERRVRAAQRGLDTALPPPRRRADASRRARSTACAATILAPDALRARASRATASAVGAFELRARRGDRHVAAGSAATTSSCAATGPSGSARRRSSMISGVPAHVDGRMLEITAGRRRQRHPPRPHVALHRGHPQLGPDLAAARHPHPARPVVAVAGRDRQAPAGAAVPRLRHARHARAHHAHRPRPHVVRADPEDHREGVRALGLRAEPGHHRQERPRAAAARASARARRRPVEAFKRHGADFVVARDLRDAGRRA